MVKKRRLFSLLLALMMVLHLPATAFAAATYTVTFYTNASRTTIHETQKVAQGAHPKVPASKPAAYESNGYRYECSGWYWTVDGATMAFSFTSDDCEIWSNTVLYAGYTQYLAKGYELIVEHATGTAHITDTKTPISTLLKKYTDITKAYTQKQSGSSAKKANPLRLKVSSKTYQQKKLKKAASFQIGASGKGTLTYTLNAKAKAAKLKVSKTGAVTVPKKCKKGTFKITVKAAGNSGYKAATKDVTIRVK